MLYTALLALLPLASAALSAQQEALVVRELSALSFDAALDKRAVSSSTYLASIFGLVTTGCNSTCSLATQDFIACAALPSQASIAACACSAQAIGDVRSCAACISADKKTSSTDEKGVVADYNAYVDLCTSEGLASVTGTVQVGASTSSLARTSLGTKSTKASSAAASASASASTSVESKATYNPDTSITSVAKVPSLVASGVSVSTGVQGVASASQSASPSSGGEKVVFGFGAMVVAVAGAAALL